MINDILISLADQGLPPQVIAIHLDLATTDVVTVLAAANIVWALQNNRPDLLPLLHKQAVVYNITGLPYPQAAYRAQGGGGLSWRQFIRRQRELHPLADATGLTVFCNRALEPYGKTVSFYAVSKWFKEDAL